MMGAKEAERSLRLFGTGVRLLVGEPSTSEDSVPEATLDRAESALRQVHETLTRFDDASELSRLNRDPREVVEASPLLLAAVSAALDAAALTGGLVDPVVEEGMRSIGYERSREGLEPADLQDALGEAPSRQPAAPRSASIWREVVVDEAAGTILRPPGARLDLGGTGKGFAADIAAAILDGHTSWCADVGGDLRFGGSAGLARSVAITSPFAGAATLECELVSGSIATSGLAKRIWRSERGFEHHLLDPSTGRPAWTGVVQATAVAGSGVEAEALAKSALLSGAERGAELLAATGGILILDSGEVRPLGALADRLTEAVPA